ncbi:MAG: SGNH/GDSL hydrolase family protein [Planctomycetales bacterium]|nr:SGNH/GDSL hydrolase family protein [Planctomycetales bacterium]
MSIAMHSGSLANSVAVSCRRPWPATLRTVSWLTAWCLVLPQLAWADTPADATVKPVLGFGDKPVTIVCLGDSVTGVYYHTGGRRAYPEMLEVAIKLAVPKANVTVINAGISGNTTQDGLNRLERDVLSKKPDLVTVSFGLNDMTRIPEDQFRKNLETIIARCREAKSNVVLCTPNAVISTGGRPTDKLERYCEVIRATARDLNVAVCDQYRAGAALRTNDAWAWRTTLSDEIHPNMDGHKLMAEELCRTITGKEVSLQDVGPLAPTLRKTLALLKQEKPVRVLAMSPFDKLIGPAIKQLQSNAVVEVTAWPTEGKTLGDLERAANQIVRAMKPDLVVLAVPRTATADSDEQFVRSYSWIMNWSLSFGHQEWDCFVVHPSVVSPGPPAPRDDLVRRLIKAQDLSLLDRAAGDDTTTEGLLSKWLAQDR